MKASEAVGISATPVYDPCDPRPLRISRDAAANLTFRRELTACLSLGPIIHTPIEREAGKGADRQPPYMREIQVPKLLAERLAAAGRRHERSRSMGRILDSHGEFAVTWRDQGRTAVVSIERRSWDGDILRRFEVPFECLARFFDAFFIGTEPQASRSLVVARLRRAHRRTLAAQYRRDPLSFWQSPWRNHRLRRDPDLESIWTGLTPEQVQRWTRVWHRLVRRAERWVSDDFLQALYFTDEPILLEQVNNGTPAALAVLDVLTDPDVSLPAS